MRRLAENCINQRTRSRLALAPLAFSAIVTALPETAAGQADDAAAVTPSRVGEGCVCSIARRFPAAMKPCL